MPKINDDREVNIRFMVSEELHQKVQKAQGLFTFKEGKKTPIGEVYIRLVELGLAEIKKFNHI